jgi:pseudaminic acid synthase
MATTRAKPFIVAEMSANHLGSLKRALDIVEAAACAGADGLKVQTWTPGRMCVDKTYTLDHGPWAGKRLYDLYEEAFLPWEWHHEIFARARKLGLVPFSAAFDWEAVDFLETLSVDRHKVASFELTDLPLIRYMASKGKPMILSTGMATEDEILDALMATCDWTRSSDRHPRVTLLKCTSAYPADPANANLAAIPHWPGYVMGLSDHTLGHEAAVIATALGASMIEKHLTLSRKDGGPDAGFSMEPQEFKDMAQAVRRASAALGEVKYGPQPGEDTTLRRSLWVVKDISEGEPLRFGDNVVTARPALGLPPSTSLTGKRAARALTASTPLKQEDVA